jgi:electron transport complex protein RnfB
VSEQPPWDINKPALMAYIREDECIGCTKCIPDCPTDAIMGAAKLMHTVITDVCTGCELCVPTCPVDCIEIRPIPETSDTDKEQLNQLWLQRFRKHNQRIATQPPEFADKLDSVDARKAYIQEILNRKKNG